MVTGLLSQHLVPKDSESPAVPPNFAFWGDGKKKFSALTRRPVPAKLAPSLRQCSKVRVRIRVRIRLSVW